MALWLTSTWMERVRNEVSGKQMYIKRLYVSKLSVYLSTGQTS